MILNFFFFFILFSALSCPAQAYLDGGVGSMLLQLLLGGVAGAGIVLRMYWGKFLSFFKREK